MKKDYYTILRITIPSNIHISHEYVKYIFDEFDTNSIQRI